MHPLLLLLLLLLVNKLLRKGLLLLLLLAWLLVVLCAMLLRAWLHLLAVSCICSRPCVESRHPASNYTARFHATMHSMLRLEKR
jgi:hypothetical protein